MVDELIWKGEHHGHEATVVIRDNVAVPLLAGNPHMLRHDWETIVLAALRDMGLARVRARMELPGDVESIVADVDRRWCGVPEWIIFDDENDLGIVRTRDGRIVAETNISGGTHADAVRIVHARVDLSFLCVIVRGQCKRIGELEAENSELKLDVDENVAHGKMQGERIRALEKERDEARARLARLEDACRNVLTTEPPLAHDVEKAWSTCVCMDQYQDWFHRQFNLNMVADLLESSNE